MLADRINAPSSPLLNVCLTVDVECSMGGAWTNPAGRPVPPERIIFCRKGNHSYGIEFLVGELKRFGLSATFFLEVFATRVFGHRDMSRVVESMASSDQDIQLHLHPIFLRYAERCNGMPSHSALPAWPDDLSAYHEEEQYRLLQQGVEIFYSLLNRQPLAFRAGGYMVNRATLRCLKKLGFLLDSSFNPASESSFRQDPPAVNQASAVEGIVEIPVSAVQTHFPDSTPLKHLEISAISSAEMRFALEEARLGGIQNVVIVFHSFSTIKRRDASYEHFRPDRIVIRRFRRLLAFLAENPSKFRVCTFSELTNKIDALSLNDRVITLPDLGRLKPLVRKTVQAANRLYWL
jgi:hypothetical protein